MTRIRNAASKDIRSDRVKAIDAMVEQLAHAANKSPAQYKQFLVLREQAKVTGAKFNTFIDEFDARYPVKAHNALTPLGDVIRERDAQPKGSVMYKILDDVVRQRTAQLKNAATAKATRNARKASEVVIKRPDGSSNVVPINNVVESVAIADGFELEYA